ncbi:hypothetical protein GQ43DRAFT_445332 [Delitschia confertaspora ATCC 74209]|uniref:Mediator of RNA polymerase II transcription subunit 4 n=1 Tax=Delitschia confertaspora ATCC 74209 TaxID=1513339 RepID=A0A9P4JDA6_9PLEO|nr:hypothetical protein GQ43DRAFT_445332 [Delitschia confertaspora ATCC 74209]
MDAILTTRFSNLETALTTLIDSITTYNPSPQAAEALISADAALSSSLDLLSIHQANNARILSLRTSAERLESQVKENLMTLAELRHELLKTPATKFKTEDDYGEEGGERRRKVEVGELLRFAQNISRFTVPPTYREPLPKLDEPLLSPAPAPTSVDPSDAHFSGIRSTAATVASPAIIPPLEADFETKDKDKEQHEDAKFTDPTPQQSEWLRQLQESGNQWVPWPNNDRVRAGNLMQVQHLIDRGQDPKVALGPEQREREEEERKRTEAEEEERVTREQEELEREREQRLRGAAPAGGQRPVVQHQPAVFGGLDIYDPDDD